MRIAVVHLARRQNPPGAFPAFWKSYQDHAPGADHDLILVWKNFIGVEHPNIPGAENVRHLVLSDEGGDLDVYFSVAKMFDYDAFVFLNSWTAIHRDGWLGILRDSLVDRVGLVGAFSRVESHRTNMFTDYPREWKQAGPRKKLTLPLFFAYAWLRLGSRIPAHPNFHVRTNGFMMRRDLLLRVHKPRLRDKLDALAFESGHRSLTRQVQALGYEVRALDAQKLMGDNRVNP